MSHAPLYDQPCCSRRGRGDLHACGPLRLGLHAQEELRAYTAETLANSETLKNLGNTTMPRKELFESLRREVECVAQNSVRRTSSWAPSCLRASTRRGAALRSCVMCGGRGCGCRRASVLSKASTAVWGLLQSDEGIGKEITEKVGRGGGGGRQTPCCMH
jgi:hypothetical protein